MEIVTLNNIEAKEVENNLINVLILAFFLYFIQ